MDKQELITKLKELPQGDWSTPRSNINEYKNNNPINVTTGHKIADLMLLEYINDPEITEIFKKIEKCY